MKQLYSTSMVKATIRLVITVLILGLTANLSFAAPESQSSVLTPLQQGIVDTLNQRADSGFPVPTIEYDSQISGVLSSASLAQPFIMTSTTILQFDGPEQAGFDEWPPLVVPNSFASDAQGQVVEADYTQTFRAAIEQQSPEILQQYAFGQEPRTLRITERLLYAPAPSPLIPLGSGSTSTSENILMGFTYRGPTVPPIEFEPEFELCVGATCVSLRLGYRLGWALGLRLPADITLSGPAVVNEEETYALNAQLEPLDWSPDQYESVGIAGEDGNEFAVRFTATVFAEVTMPILGTVEIEAGLDYDDASRSFETPFGTGSSFPVPVLENIPIISFPVFGILNVNLGAGVEFILSSTDITADWAVIAPESATGQGTITFSEPDELVSLEPIQANDLPPDAIEVELSNFRYGFESFDIGLSLNISISLGPITSPTLSIDLFTLDLSSIIGEPELYVGQHVQCTWDFICAPVGPDNTLLLTTFISELGAAPARNYHTTDTPTLTWQRITWATGYEVQIANNPTFRSPTTYSAGTDLLYITPPLTTGLHYWRVRAQRSNGSWGSWSKPDSLLIIPD